jgi:hypothetical protein
MAPRNILPKLKNKNYKQKLKTIDADVVVRKSRRNEKRLPENEGMYPDMRRVNEQLPEQDLGSDDEDLQLEYTEPLRAHKRNGVTPVSNRNELPFQWVPPVEEIHKQRMPPLNVGMYGV